MTIKIGYFRVSKEEETSQDLDRHIEVTLNKYNINQKEIKIYKERHSAYAENNFAKRQEFMNFLQEALNVDSITLKDLFLNKVKCQEPIEIYSYDFSRFSRIMKYGLLFGLLCDLYDVKVYTYKEGHIERHEEESPAQILARMIMYSITSFSAQDYSYHTSQNIKKSVIRDEGIVVSSKGNAWGKYGRDAKGNKKQLTPQDKLKIQKFVIKEITKLHLPHYSYNRIINNVKDKFDVTLQKSYITRLKLYQPNNLNSPSKLGHK